MNIQTIISPSGEELVVIPRADYEKLVEGIEERIDIADAKTILARIKNGREEVFPAELVHSILDGESPIRAFRTHRSLTQAELAKKANINPVYLSTLERGTRNPSPQLLERLAKALRIDVEMLGGPLSSK